MGNAENNQLTDEVKASVLRSGLTNNLKQVVYNDEKRPSGNQVDGLRQQAQAVIGEIQQLLNAGTLNAEASKKLSEALHLLQGELAKKNISPAELSAAITDAAIAQVNAEGGPNSPAVKKRIEKLWHQVDVDNKAIDDDFAKMQKAGVVFNPTLMNRHKELMEYLQAHPRDLAKQKELDAVDDTMLMQAEPQISKNPDAKSSFDDAGKKSKDRHEAVDKALAAITKDAAISNADFDKDSQSIGQSQRSGLTTDDIISPPVGQKPDSAGNKFVHKQKNIRFRTKSNRNPALPVFHSARNRLKYSLIYNSNWPCFHESDGKFCSKVNVGLLHNGFCLTQRCLQPMRKIKNEKGNHVLPGINGQAGRKRFGDRRADQGSEGFCNGEQLCFGRRVC